VLAYGFTENGQLPAKTDRNSVFHGPNPHILDRIYLMVSYMSFYGFSKNSNFRSKSIGVSLQFYRLFKNYGFSLKILRCQPTILPKIASLWQKLTETPYFLVMTPYSGSVIVNGTIYEFLQVFKKFKILLKIYRC
jgi:hypothetical protein